MPPIAKSNAGAVANVLLLITLLAAPADAARPSDVASGPEPSVVLDGMWNTLAELHSGVCTAQVSISFRPGESEHAEYSFVFDFDSGHSRIDRRFPDTGRLVTRVDSPDETIFHEAGSRIVQRQPPFSGPRVEGEDPFDVRIVPLISFAEFALSNEDITCASWETFRAHLDELPAPRVSPRDGGVFAVTWETAVPIASPNGDGGEYYDLYRRVTLVDPRERFVPTRTEIWVGAGPTKEIAGRLYAVTETKWAVKENVSVPTGCVFDSVGEPERAELRLDWESVGGTVDPRVFTVEGLDLPIGTMILNDRLGPQIIESVVGEPSLFPVPTGAQSGAWRWILTGLSVAAIVAALAALALRKMMRSRHAG